TDYFLTIRPAYPWSVYPVGLPALAAAAGLLVLLTLWAYLKHPQATRKRVMIVLALRLLALTVALVTALRPSLGIQEEPKVLSNQLHARWQGEQFVRGLAVVGDGADNGRRFNALAEAARLRAAGVPVSTFAVGTQTPPNAVRDVGIATVTVDPDPVPIKNDVT